MKKLDVNELGPDQNGGLSREQMKKIVGGIRREGGGDPVCWNEAYLDCRDFDAGNIPPDTVDSYCAFQADFVCGY